MRGCVGQAVARQHPVEAAATHPVVDRPVLILVIHELDPGTTGHQEVRGGLGDVAPMVEPVGTYIRGKGHLDFSRQQVPAKKFAGIPTAGRRSRPDQAVDNEQVFRGLVAPAFMRCLPERLAGLEVDRGHGTVSARGDQDIVMYHQLGSKVKGYRRFPTDRLRRPLLLAGIRIHANDLVTIMEVNPVCI